ncbi:MAG: UDP-N-acetylglucosamine--N-acetylmuramyl-(pentapeptide) pyrophosphoryl-undecaprenol N-acetylglucosamine transferase [Thermoleophilia bacterium]|jgi:UDP-N-acetylglucosamine--N-acetylmuramyl-(pentapeptide) pyrophosphoryl-undecaprenol N-acetylglucosamine transferase|nr:UDP-N-acetylglucosamine--N-acetylmuramyl-(pentapeptide) pyrophosphoryl-undecaprenol N-acetylglucosamine transferase [Thermoleophilia bacterium]
MPALALAEALRGRGAEVSFVGVPARVGSDLVEAAGYPEDRVALRGLERRITPRNLLALWQAAVAVPRMIAILRRREAAVVVGAGGYVAGPAAIAGWITRRPVLLMEADSRLGVANRLAAPLARRVALAFPLPGRGGRRYVVTGRPVSAAVRRATRTAGRRAFGVGPDETCVLVAGGSQGARSLNVAAVDAFGDGPPFALIHVAGPRQVDEVRGMLGGRDPGPRYRLVGYLDNFPEAVAAADLVVSRSGGTVFELAAIGRASVLVPYPHATGDHQTTNARWLAEAGAAVLLPDEECSGRHLRELVGALLADRRRLEHMGEAARAVGRPDAADHIAGMVVELATRRRGRRRRRRR